MVKRQLPESECCHQVATLAFERTGTRLHPRVFMVERCIDCAKELDRKKFPSMYDVYSRRSEKP
jgi:hypothetical protein